MAFQPKVTIGAPTAASTPAPERSIGEGVWGGFKTGAVPGAIAGGVLGALIAGVAISHSAGGPLEFVASVVGVGLVGGLGTGSIGAVIGGLKALGDG